MVRRHKKQAFEVWITPYRMQADPDTDYVIPWFAHKIVTNRHFARICRITQIRLKRRMRHPKGYSPLADAAWAHRAYGRKGKNKWRVK